MPHALTGPAASGPHGSLQVSSGDSVQPGLSAVVRRQGHRLALALRLINGRYRDTPTQLARHARTLSAPLAPRGAIVGRSGASTSKCEILIAHRFCPDASRVIHCQKNEAMKDLISTKQGFQMNKLLKSVPISQIEQAFSKALTELLGTSYEVSISELKFASGLTGRDGAEFHGGAWRKTSSEPFSGFGDEESL